MIKTVFINLSIRKQEQMESYHDYADYHAAANRKFEEQQTDLNTLIADGWMRIDSCPVDLGVEKSIAIVLYKPDQAIAVDSLLATRNLIDVRKRDAADFIEAMHDDTHDPEAGMFQDTRTPRELIFDFVETLTGQEPADGEAVLSAVRHLLNS